MQNTADTGLIDVLSTAIDGFAARLAKVATGDWARQTPCTEWDVRALVNHVAGANLRYQLILRGAPVEEVEATRAVDHLGDDPLASFKSSAAAMVRAFCGDGVLARTFRHVAGERTGEQLLAMRIFDIGVHTWDLAVAIGAEEQIDERVVAVGLGAVARAHDERDALPAQERLLLRSGRQPREEIHP